MRLINCHNFGLEDFAEENKPPYAIVSHTSQASDIVFKDYCNVDELKKKPGFEKLSKTCGIALSFGCDYCWIDTCCVDKSNFGEWSEAVNSMFKWYQNSAFCIAYLSDFEGVGLGADSECDSKVRLKAKAGLGVQDGPPAYSEVDGTHSLADLGQCRWFSCGWTLQQLIAPRYVQFYDSQWRFYLEKREFATELSRITGVPVDTIKSMDYQSRRYSVAEIMFWASSRTTTQVEDMSYCLFGLFEINLPLIYGEGGKAFFRLQEEIIRTRPDLSIFAWQTKTPDKDLAPRDRIRGLLARSPAEFSLAGGISSSGPTRGPEMEDVTEAERLLAGYAELDSRMRATRRLGSRPRSRFLR
ncbi:hypothetical protein DM02DRAFT_637793 [Periconia macrospinosa]|uniref:Uncharacterized protein n=1 Tax=Periconia macrospinosa TaxID=97972 RepID=A0A2V1EEW3_9PLEO|nr:hypothetical protein DM02DRAFT_637793 [Periconia macrospinosa]